MERFACHDELFHIEGRGLDVFLQRDFLSQSECNELIALIEADNFPSRLMGHTPDKNFRTSSSSPLSRRSNALMLEIDQRIADFTGIRMEHQEGSEGQRYRVGQQFKPHFDAFLPGHEYYPVEMAIGGQRTWTVMLALNDPEAGGGTMFPTAGLRIRPRTGNLVAWCSLDTSGRINPASLHCGEPVLAGSKYILTKWHRERPFRPERKARVLGRLKNRSSVRSVPPNGSLAGGEMHDEIMAEMKQ